jgi:hypothetical protein
MNDDFEDINTLLSLTDNKVLTSGNISPNLIEEVADKVQYYMENNMELFFNHLYRLDVDEKKVRKVIMNPPESESVYVILAKLIIEREIKRMETKKQFSQEKWIDI